jgi:hypothetical protein
MKNPSSRDKLNSVFEDISSFVAALALADMAIAFGLVTPKVGAALLAVLFFVGMWWALWNLLRL